jgi:hypothetical protein
MITAETKSSPVITNITSAPTRFKIKASARAFKILSGFYSEPILAIPRELGANAWDSHVKAGNTGQMFEVHAPNQLEPWFSVRDFGTGLSPEDIDSIYTTYFESTKNGENDSDGCMGLGSKTPFNYTDNFNVTSWIDGQKHVYSCFIDESGSPNILHVNTSHSDAHAGLEVKFGVKTADIGMWVDKITRAYAPFRNRPKIVGAKINWPTREYLYEGGKKDWGYRKGDGYNSQRGTNAFMGNYCYPVSATALSAALRKEFTDYNQRNIMENALSYGHFDFFFNIGDLEVAPNKEQLQYEDDNSTTTRIILALKEAIAELKVIALKNVEIPKTRWEAMKLYTKYNSHSSEYYHLREIIGDIPVEFAGKKVTASHDSVITTHSATGIINGNNPVNFTFQLYSLDTVYGKIKKTGTYSSSHSRELVILYTNGETIKNARLRHYLANNYGTGNMPMCYIITDASPKAKNFQLHRDYFGWDKDGVTIIEIESLPKPPPAARVKKTATTDEIFYTTVSNSVTKYGKNNQYSVGWNRKGETIDSTKTYYYMDFLWQTPAYKNENISQTMMNDIIKVYAEAKLNKGEDTFYGINAKNKNLLKIGTWVNIAELVAKYVAKHKDTFEQRNYLWNTYRNEILECSRISRVLDRGHYFLSSLANPDTKALLTNFQTNYKKFEAASDYELGTEFYTGFDITAKRHVADPVDLKELEKILTKKYMKLFDIADDYNNDGKSLANIVNFIDANS